MSWIKVWYVIPLLELNLSGFGYVSCVQVVHNVGKPETDLFFIAGEFWDCSQIILPLGGKGCSRSAHLAVLTMIVYGEFRIRCTLPYYYPFRRSREYQRSEIRSDIRWYSAILTIPNTTHLFHEELSDYTIYVEVFLPWSTGLPFCKSNYKEYRVWYDPRWKLWSITEMVIRVEYPYLEDSTDSTDLWRHIQVGYDVF
jgi:hypothetical protein